MYTTIHESAAHSQGADSGQLRSQPATPPDRARFPAILAGLAKYFAVVALVFAVAVPGLCQAQYKEESWPAPAVTAVQSPSPWHWGQVVGVAPTTHGNLLVLHRGAYPIMEFRPDGAFVRAWGNDTISEGKVTLVAREHRAPGASGFAAVYGPAGCYSCGAHSIRVDVRGNTWIVDAAAHTVAKFGTDGVLKLRLGEEGVAGADTAHFNLPTDVAFGPNGEIYVSDGYGNARIVKFSKDGEYLLEWGRRGTAPGEFALPHNLATDARGKVYVTDRDNHRIQVFDDKGKYLDEWANVGPVSNLYMTADQRLWTGHVLRNLDGEAIVSLPNEPAGHGTAVADSGDVYIAQLEGNVRKYVPTSPPPSSMDSEPAP